MEQKIEAASVARRNDLASWDYSKHAEFYRYRPNYAPKAVDMLIEYTEAKKTKDFRVADIGAGTGNLTKMLLERGLNVTPVEPNDEMRKIGIEETKNYNVKWSAGTGTATGLESGRYNWVTFGSSFNVIDRELGLQETYRLSPPPPPTHTLPVCGTTGTSRTPYKKRRRTSLKNLSHLMTEERDVKTRDPSLRNIQRCSKIFAIWRWILK
jgi:ubiquinone/menaquinone biosynthesis C-methylase UbiE